MSSIPIVQSEPHLSSRDQWQCNSSQPWQPTRPAALILQWRFWLPVYRRISKISDSALKAVTWFKGVRVRGGSQRSCSNESQWLPNDPNSTQFRCHCWVWFKFEGLRGPVFLGLLKPNKQLKMSWDPKVNKSHLFPSLIMQTWCERAQIWAAHGKNGGLEGRWKKRSEENESYNRFGTERYFNESRIKKKTKNYIIRIAVSQSMRGSDDGSCIVWLLCLLKNAFAGCSSFVSLLLLCWRVWHRFAAAAFLLDFVMK
jgi:hypothetical protein